MSLVMSHCHSFIDMRKKRLSLDLDICRFSIRNLELCQSKFSGRKYLFWWTSIFSEFFFSHLCLQKVDGFRSSQHFTCWSDVLLLVIFNSFLWYKGNEYFHLFVCNITHIFNEDTTKPQLWLKSAPCHQTVLSPHDFQVIVNIHSNFSCIGEAGNMYHHFD